LRWPRPAVFGWLQAHGNIPEAEMHRTFNCGIGMILVMAREHAAAAIAMLGSHGVPAWDVGSIVARTGDAPQTVVV
jgi:phosphoribosylformylglycinamidine cyclo-ligase